jgi:hypothetical protein
MTHASILPERRAAVGNRRPCPFRPVSDIDDLKEDLLQALEAV